MTKIEYKKDFLYLAIVILFALALRLPLLSYFNVVTPDSILLIEIAKTIGNGEYFTVNVPIHHHHPLYPSLMAFVSLITFLGYVKSGQLISILAALLTVVLVYKLSAKIYNRKTAIYSALILSLVPLHALYSVLILKDSLYVLMVLSMIYSCIMALKSQRKRYFIMAGLFLGLAYLARFDGILLLLILPVFLYFIYKENDKNIKHYTLLTIGIAASVYAIFAVILSIQTGSLTISKKFNFYVNPIFATNAAKAKLKKSYGQEKAEKLIRTNTQFSGFIIKRIEGLYKNLHYILPFVFPTLLIFIAGIGLSGYQFGKIEILILIVPFIYLFIFPFLKYPNDNRYILCITPFLSILAGKGLCFLQEKLLNKHNYLPRIALFIFLLIFVPLIYKPILDDSPFQSLLEFKKIGSFIASQGETDETGSIISPSPVIAFYAKLNPIPLSYSKNEDEVIRQIEDDNVGFVVISEEFAAITDQGKFEAVRLDKAGQFKGAKGEVLGIYKIKKQLPGSDYLSHP